MLKIRFHGRGGQGVVIASNILGNTVFYEGKSVLSAPKFGVERRGAPVTAFLRIDNKKIRERYEIQNPDCVIILDETLINAPGVNVTAGLKKDGWIIINSTKTPEDFSYLGDFKIATVPATEIAIKHGIGTKTNPIVNTTILGAVLRVLFVAQMESLAKIIAKEIPIKTEKNIEAAKEAYASTKTLFDDEFTVA